MAQLMASSSAAYPTVNWTRASRDTMPPIIGTHYGCGFVSSVSSEADNSLRVLRRYIAKSAGMPAGLGPKTGLRVRLASTPNASNSLCEYVVQRGTRHHDSTLGGPFHNPCGDVHIHTQPIGGQPLRAAGVDADPHPRCVAGHLDRSQRLLGGQHGPHGDGRIAEHGHQPVAHALDDVLAGVQQRWFDGAGHLAQQRQGGVVAGLQRPGGKPDQVGEDQRHLRIGRTPRDALGQRLPHLQHPEADLTRYHVAVPQQPSAARAAVAGGWTADRRSRGRPAATGAHAGPGPPPRGCGFGCAATGSRCAPTVRCVAKPTAPPRIPRARPDPDRDARVSPGQVICFRRRQATTAASHVSQLA